MLLAIVLGPLLRPEAIHVAFLDLVSERPFSDRDPIDIALLLDLVSKCPFGYGNAVDIAFLDMVAEGPLGYRYAVDITLFLIWSPKAHSATDTPSKSRSLIWSPKAHSATSTASTSRKMPRALLSGALVDSYIGNYTHTEHCERVLTWEGMEKVSVRIGRKFVGCGVLGEEMELYQQARA